VKSSHLFHNLVTKTALLIYNETAYSLDGPFSSREDAEEHAANLISKLSAESKTAEEPSGRDVE
jgi:hypothetical protein